MTLEKNESGLWLSQSKPEDMPRFELRTFLVYRQSDISKFKLLVENKRGIWEGWKQINLLNYKNQPVLGQFVCLYQFHEDLAMEVLC